MKNMICILAANFSLCVPIFANLSLSPIQQRWESVQSFSKCFSNSNRPKVAVFIGYRGCCFLLLEWHCFIIAAFLNKKVFKLQHLTRLWSYTFLIIVESQQTSQQQKQQLSLLPQQPSHPASAWEPRTGRSPWMHHVTWQSAHRREWSRAGLRVSRRAFCLKCGCFRNVPEIPQRFLPGRSLFCFSDFPIVQTHLQRHSWVVSVKRKGRKGSSRCALFYLPVTDWWRAKVVSCR